MKLKEILVFGASGQIGRNLIRKLTNNNYKVIAVTRNIHQKGYILKTQSNPGYLEIEELKYFNIEKIRSLIKNCRICINLIGILFEKKKIILRIFILTFQTLFQIYQKNIILKN